MIDPGNPDFENTPTSSQRPRFGYAPADRAGPACVTIVTPFYNSSPLFHETARSVLQQSFQQWKWLIVNDGSSDGASLSVLDVYRNADARIQVIDHTTNKGPSAARNTGFRTAHTQYVFQLDSDDLIEPTTIEKCLWFLESHPEFSFVNSWEIGFGSQQYLWNVGFERGRDFLEESLIGGRGLVRVYVHRAVAGYDETIREGFEDWDFWLRCANSGYWGATLPEHLYWYRRRPNQGDQWKDWGNAQRQKAFRERLRQQYAQLWDDGFPLVEPRPHMPNETAPNNLPCENPLLKSKPRVLMILPWMTIGGADTFNLDLLQELTRRGWDITVATTLQGDHSWLPQFAHSTPDIFILHHFLRLVDYPRFLRYLIQSRRPDVVLLSHSELGYLLLPYMRAFCPGSTYLDFCHNVEEYWKSGGYPQMSTTSHEQLDLTVASSQYLKKWMVQRGADANRLEVCYTSIDPEEWQADRRVRAKIRQELAINNETPVILYAGRLCRQKQPKVFAQTMKQLHDQGLEFRALVAGDGEDRPWLEHFVYHHHLGEQVQLLGPASRERMRALMMAADIFFLPSAWEGIALTMYEAMACGLTVVGADVGGQQELVTKECGVLLPRGEEQVEVQQYTKSLAELLAEPSRRAVMGQRARDRICEEFRLEGMGDRMLALFERASVLQDAHPRRTVSHGLGLACATQAVEYMRLHHVADWMWLEREGHQGKGLPLPALLYTRLRRIGRPLYLLGLQRGWHWLTPVKDGVKRRLLTRFGQSL